MSSADLLARLPAGLGPDDRIVGGPDEGGTWTVAVSTESDAVCGHDAHSLAEQQRRASQLIFPPPRPRSHGAHRRAAHGTKTVRRRGSRRGSRTSRASPDDEPHEADSHLTAGAAS